MNFLTRLLLIFIFTAKTATGYTQNTPYNPDRLYTVDELKADFRCLRDSIEKIHPNLYMYTPKPIFDTFFDSLYKSITQPLTDMGFYNIVTLLNGKIKNGHTMFLPGDSTTAYFNRNCRFFPFYMRILNDRLFVSMNCSPDTAIQAGAEILSVNGTTSTAILNFLMERQIRDGYNTTYPVWILDNYFKEYYGFAYGHADEFTIVYKNNGIQPQTEVINALTKDSIKYYRNTKYSNRIANDKKGRGITLELNKTDAYAILTIKTFGTESLQSTYKQNFKTTIDSVFSLINLNKCNSLILDLRDNQGGDFENGQLLLSYLLGSPFRLLMQGQATEVVYPLKNRFSGKLYILINGGSFSNTAIVCSRLAFYKRGIFVGEETGGNTTIISGFADDENDIQLPNTKINCAIPNTSFLIRANSKNNGHGTIPNYYISPNLNDIITNKDAVRNFAVRLVTKKK